MTIKNKAIALLTRFRRDDDGATLVEYGVALGLAVALGATAMVTLSGDVNGSMIAAGAAMPGESTPVSTE